MTTIPPDQRPADIVTIAKAGKLCSNPPVEKDVFIGLGANEGDRELNLLRAVAEIGKLPYSRISALSSFYDTEPVGGLVQEPFLNAVLRLETELAPRELLEALQQIETKVFRRKRTIPGGPRPIDLDILCYGDRILAEADLVIPHPRLQERRFVLVPLVEIAPQYVHPGLQNSVTELLRKLKPLHQRVTKI